MYLPQEADDADLVQRTLAGDTGAFETLIQRHQRPLFTVAYRMLGNREDAADALQGALVKAYEHLAQFDARRKFFSWMYRIVINECLNMRRSRRPEDALSPALAAAGTPFDLAAAGQRAVQVQQALLGLSDESRAVIVLRHFADLSYDEIAEAVGVPAKTVKSRLYEARQKLGEQLLGWRPRS